jgi:hypothetical protein
VPRHHCPFRSHLIEKSPGIGPIFEGNQRAILCGADCLAEDAVISEPVSGLKFPLTGKFAGNLVRRPGLIACILLVNAGVNRFQSEIVTGNEQGNSRTYNRENVVRNRPIIASRYLGTQLLKVFHKYSRLCHLPVCQFGIMDSSERLAAAKTKVANLVTFSLPIFPEMSSRSQETCLWITSV